MMTNREISENFEVQINTLYNWRKTKPKLYKYLSNADYNFERTKEINILLGRFAKDIDCGFLPDEILEFVESKFEAKSIDDIEHLEQHFIKEHSHRLQKEGEYLLGIYDKLHKMNIIEKYIFYKRVYNLRSEHKKPNREHILEYFDVFCSV